MTRNVCETAVEEIDRSGGERQLAKLKSELPGTIVGTVKDAQRRRAI